jgi:hypothetical protein
MIANMISVWEDGLVPHDQPQTASSVKGRSGRVYDVTLAPRP